MSDEQDTTPTESADSEPQIMPGAELMDQPENIDLNFELTEETAEEPETEPEKQEAKAEEPEVAEEPAEETEVEEESTDKVEEPEAEPEKQEAEAEEPEAEPEKRKKPMVPKARLDQALTKQKELQRKIDEYTQKEAEVAEPDSKFDFNQAETQYQEALLDGKQEDAAKLRNEIRSAERELLRHEMREEMSHEIGANKELASIQETAAELEAEYTVFDQNHEDFNAEYAQEVVAIRDGLMSHDMAGPEALKKAALMVVQTYDLKGVTPAEPALAEKKVSKADTVDEVARKRKQVSQKLKAAEAQPPELPGESSAQHGEKSVEDLHSMSEDEFNALPEATIARLRGDFI